MTLEIEGEVAPALDALRGEVVARGGYLESSAHSSDDFAELEIRVPASELDGLRDAIAERGTVTRTAEEVEDMTFAHADVEARVASAREEEQRLLALYADRAASLAEVLLIEHELTRVRGEVERLEAESRVLADRVAMARLSLGVVRAGVPFARDPLGAIASAGAAGLRAAGTMALGAAVAFVAVVPSIVLVLALAALAWRGLRLVRRWAA